MVHRAVRERQIARARFRSRRYRSMPRGMANRTAATTTTPKSQPGRMDPPIATIKTAQAATQTK